MPIDQHVQHSGKGQTRRTKCKHCHKVISSASKSRWQQYMRQCSVCPADVKNQFSLTSTSTTATFVRTLQHTVSLAEVLSTLQPTALETAAFNATCGINALNWVDRCTSSERAVYDTAFANIFFTTGIPFATASANSIGSFIKLLRPSWDPPSAKTISGTLLDKAHERIVAAMETAIAATDRVAIATDD